MSPVLDTNQKILLDNQGNIRLRSTGSGGFLLNLAKFGVLNTWAKQNIEYLHFIGVRDLLARTGDPISLGSLIQNGKDILIDVCRTEEQSQSFPTVMISNNS